MEKRLSDKDISTLRNKGLLNEGEVAFKLGEVIVAEHIIDKTRRIIDVSTGVLLECNKVLLID